MKRKFLDSALILCFVLVLGFAAYSLGQVTAQPAKPPAPAPLPTADLQIKWVAASPCGCEAETQAVDAIILLGPVTVRVHNPSQRAVDAEVTVEAMFHRHGAASSSQTVHLEKNQALNVVFFQNYGPQKGLLVCRSKGIKATVKLTGGAAFDPNPANNTLTIHGCRPIVE